MGWTFDSQRPIYVQLVEEIVLRIVTGQYPPGGKIPSVRDLAAEAVVNPNTMQRALAELENMGLLFSERTSGRFVTEDSDRIDREKRKLAKQHINTFFHAMKELGYEREDVLSMANEAKEMITV